ncbi:MAG: AAA family ATPase [Oscillospiraceae bacterium]|jgi:hypothetical protein|nr:AAA family ATPase [Oscillospiraceae bacterium]
MSNDTKLKLQLLLKHIRDAEARTDVQALLRRTENTNLLEIIKMEILFFSLAVIDSNRNIAFGEEMYYNDITKLFGGEEYISTGRIQSLISSQADKIIKYLNSVPVWIQWFTEIDNNTMERSTKPPYVILSKLLLDAYRSIGWGLVASDGVKQETEVRTLTIFLTKIENYILDNIKPKAPFRGESFELPAESGVYARPAPARQYDEPQSAQETEATLDDLRAELNALTGLNSVKEDVNSLVNLLQIRKIRQERGMAVPDMSLHLVFSGNPGTGKTTVARLLSRIYNKMGLLSNGQLIEVDRSGLVANYVGQTAGKVNEVIKRAKGGVLFIDEAYSLTVGRSSVDYGFEAVDTLLKGMEDNRGDLIVIAAGYPDRMREFLESNPGLESRFNKFVNFPDYTPQELAAIFNSLCVKNGLFMRAQAIRAMTEFFAARYLNRGDNYANGRDVRNYFEIVLRRQADRLSASPNPTDDELSELLFEDINGIMLDKGLTPFE